jgi:rhodanese-related sulfurtransferase
MGIMRLAMILLPLMVANVDAPAFAAAQDETPSTSGAKTAITPEIEWSHPEIPRIAAKDVKKLLDNGADFVLVDTQPADGYDLWHIPTAINIHYSPIGDPTNRELMLIALPMDKLIVIYCLCEEGTDSARMAIELQSLGYSDGKVKVLEGGLIKWDELGYPMIKQEIPQ